MAFLLNGMTRILIAWHRNYLKCTKMHMIGVFFLSLWEALIVLIPKPHKDHDLCEPYRPISLINVDAKILAKRLNKGIASVIHPRWLFTIVQSEGPTPDTLVVVSLDTHKAFDSIEWPSLVGIIERLGFRPRFIAWVKIYAKPKARLRVNNTITDPFNIARGTRQGCPLSPLAIEQLAALLRANGNIRGCNVNELEE